MDESCGITLWYSTKVFHYNFIMGEDIRQWFVGEIKNIADGCLCF